MCVQKESLNSFAVLALAHNLLQTQLLHKTLLVITNVVIEKRNKKKNRNNKKKENKPVTGFNLAAVRYKPYNEI